MARDDPFNGRTWIVTGAAGGIGGAVADALSVRGARVIGWDFAPITGRSSIAEAAQVDVADAASVDAALAQFAAGDVHGVVHGAGILRTGTFAESDLSEQLRVVDVNLRGTLVVVHRLLAGALADHGSIVLLGSASGYQGPPEFATYAATKAGLTTFAEALRIELEDRGIHVGVCTPLFTDTPMIHGDVADQPVLLRKFGAVHTAEEVAWSIVRGVDRRRPMILPGMQVRAMSAIDSGAGWLGAPLMRSTWRRARRT